MRLVQGCVGRWGADGQGGSAVGKDLDIRIRAFETRRPLVYALLVGLACALPYFVLLHVFRIVPSFNEGTVLAPAEGVGPVLGLFFGVPGIVGCMVGNIASDVLCGYRDVGALALRAIVEAVYLGLPYVLWYVMLRRNPAPRPLLDSAHKLGVYMGIALVTSLVAIVLNALVDTVLARVGSVMHYTILSLNDFTFLIYLGMPLLIALSQSPLPSRRPRLLYRLLNRMDDDAEPDCRAGTWGSARDLAGGEADPRDHARMNLTQRMVIAGVFGAVAVTIVLNVLYFIPYPFYQDYHEIMPDAISGAYALSAIFAVLIFVPTAVALQFLETHYTGPIERVTKALSVFLDRLREGRRVQARVDTEGVTPLNEVLDLVQAAERMQVSLADHIEQLSVALKERERVSAELDIAQRIQMSVIPHEFSRFAELGLDVYGFMRPARAVGGDFFDVFDMGEGRVGLVVGDVSGKGIPAALFMMRALNALRSQMLACDDLGAVMTATNATLYQADEVELFVTVFACVIDTRTGRVRYANAGHMPPLMRYANGELSWLECDPERIVGAYRVHRYTQHELWLEPGDGMLLYTDGITDAADASRAFFGAEGLRSSIAKAERAARRLPPDRDCGEGRPASLVRRALDFVANQVDLFASDAPQADDMTMLAFCWRLQGSAQADAGSQASDACPQPDQRKGDLR